MKITDINFNSDEVHPIGDFTPLPVGEYLVVISASERKPTSKGDGAYLQLVLDVVDKEFKGRKIFERLNLENANDTTVEIAKRTLSAICKVTGVRHPKQSEELHDIPFLVKVGITPAKGEYGASNKIVGWMNTMGISAEKIDGTTAPASKPKECAPAATSEKKMPWEKKK